MGAQVNSSSHNAAQGSQKLDMPGLNAYYKFVGMWYNIGFHDVQYINGNVYRIGYGRIVCIFLLAFESCFMIAIKICQKPQ